MDLSLSNKMLVKPKRYYGLDLVIIDNFFTNKELEEVDIEVKELNTYKQCSMNTGGATAQDNQSLKTGAGLFLDDYYGQYRDTSAILKYTTKVFNKELTDGLIKHSVSYRGVAKSESDRTLLNYYSNNEQYKPHVDRSLYTLIIMLKIGEVRGGGIKFNDVNKTIRFKNNRAVLFPGCAYHEALPVTCEAGNYRVTVAKFINYLFKQEYKC